MFPLITFPIQVEGGLWKTFKARALQEDMTAKVVIHKLIAYYIDHGLPEPPPKKPGKK